MAAGPLRRALLRVKEAAEDVYVQVRGDFAPMASMDIFPFRAAEDVARFQVTTDRVLRGMTDASFTLKPYGSFSAGCFQGSIRYDGTPGGESGYEGSGEDPEAAGKLMDVGGNRPTSHASKGGFASFRTKPDERIRDLSAFEGLEMRVKTDGRGYIANLKCAEHGLEQLWQLRLVSPPSRWVTLAVPFRDLVLTRRGRVEAHQVPLHRASFNGFGILLADGYNGPFKFEVQWVKAVRSLNADAYAAVPDAAIEAGAQASALLASRTGKSPEEVKREELLAAHRAKAAAARLGSATGSTRSSS